MENITEKLLNAFQKAQKEDLDKRSEIVTRLLEDALIESEEAVILLKTNIINITAEKIEMSTGAKIVGGSSIEDNSMGN